MNDDTRERILRELATVDATASKVSAAAGRRGFAFEEELDVLRECMIRRATLSEVLKQLPSPPKAEANAVPQTGNPDTEKPKDSTALMHNVVEPTTSEPTILKHGERNYSIGDEQPIVVSYAEDLVLTAFAQTQVAMDRGELEKKSGVSNAPAVMTQLATRYKGIFAPAVRRPGSRGKGGYFVRVRTG